MSGTSLELLSDNYGTVKFAVVAAPGLCGLEERLEELTSFYRELAHLLVGHVFLLGPVFDLHETVSRGQRLRYLADHYPREPGVMTHRVRHGPALAPAMHAAGRSDWEDLAQPMMFLRRPGFPDAPGIPVMFFWRSNPASASVPGDAVVVVAGERQPDMRWDAGRLGVGPGLFSGAEHTLDPVGGMVLDLKINNPGLTLDQTGHPCDFWDWNGTDLRKLAGC